MTILDNLRDRFSSTSGSDAEATGADGSAPAGGPPIKGYAKLDSRGVISRLSDHSQAELTAIDEYERANANRVEVLQKLRYMRGAQPMDGYDAMSPAEITTALESADMPTIKAVRAYEQKFANRADVVTTVMRVKGERQAAAPKKEVPAYQATSQRPKD